jgi:hypothetical protein
MAMLAGRVSAPVRGLPFEPSLAGEVIDKFDVLEVDDSDAVEPLPLSGDANPEPTGAEI